MKKGLLTGCLFALVGLIKAQESAPLPTGYYIDFKHQGFEELKSVGALTKRAAQARIMLSGENHMFSNFNSLGEYRFLKFFHETAGVRHFVIELSPTRALYMERYFTNTDSTAKRFLRATSSNDYMNLFDSIRIWNQTLPDSQKIKVHGLDVERFYDMTVMRLGDVIQKRGMAPSSIRMGALMATRLAHQIEKEGTEDDEDDSESESSSSEEMMDTARVVDIASVDTTKSASEIELEDVEGLDDRLDVILMNEDESDFDTEEGAMELYLWLSKYAAIDGKYADSSKVWKQWMGDDFAEYKLAFEQLREWYLWTKTDNTAQQVAWREEHMYKNMVKLLQQDPKAKFFGQFGRCHISTNKQQQDCGWFEYNSLLTRLRTRYFKNNESVLSIGIFYKEKEFDGKDICAVNLGNTLAINEEVKSILGTVDKGMMLYYTKDSMVPLTELSKKFDFVLAHDFTEESEEDDYSDGDGDESIGNNHIGFSIAGRYMAPKFFSDDLFQHYTDNGYAISDAKLFYVPMSLTFLSKRAHMEMGYAQGKKNVFSADNGERLSYRATVYHIDAGLHTGNEYSTWQWGLGLRAFHVRHQMKYVPPTIDFGNPVVNGVQTIRSLEWVPGAYVSARLRPHAGISMFAKAGYQASQAKDRRWQYKETGLNYYNGQSLGGLKAGMFAEMGITLNLDTMD
jgi:hypothetical protein